MSSFLKNLFASKPPPDNAVAVYVDELKQMGETLTNLRTQFAQYGRTVQLLSNNGLQLAHTIRHFNHGLKLTNPHVQDYAESTIHFREDIAKVWSKQYVDEVLGMFDHWNRNAEAQQSTITNYHLAREHCFTLKIELDELQDRKQGYINQKKTIPSDLVNSITKSQEQYKKYSVALENIRSAIVTNQAKLLGKNGQLSAFSRAFYALLESQCNLTSYFGALTDSYQPLLDEYRKELGIVIQPAPNQGNIIGQDGIDHHHHHQQQQQQQSYQYTDDISVLDIAHFIRQTASLEGDSTMLSDVNHILNTIPISNSNSNNNSNPYNNDLANLPQGDPLGVTSSSVPELSRNGSLDLSGTPAAGLSIQTDSPILLGRRGSTQINQPGSPSMASPTTTTDPITGLPTLSFTLSSRKKRGTMVPTGLMSPGNNQIDMLSPVAGNIPTTTTKKMSSRASMFAQTNTNSTTTPQSHYGSNHIPSFQLDEPNLFQQQLLDPSNNNNNNKDHNCGAVAAPEPQFNDEPDNTIMCAFASMPLDDDSDDIDFLGAIGGGNGMGGLDADGRVSLNGRNSLTMNTGTAFQSILERMVNEETHLVDNRSIGGNGNNGTQGSEGSGSSSTNLSDGEIKKLAQRWAVSEYNTESPTRQRISSLLSILNSLCTKYIADWVVVEIELQLWAKSPSLQLLLCTLNTLTICKQIQQYQGLPGQVQLTTQVAVHHPQGGQQGSTTTTTTTHQQPIEYGFTFRSVSADNINQYFHYVYNIFTALLQQLLGQSDNDMVTAVDNMADIFNTPGSYNEQNVQKLVQISQILRLLTIVCDKCLIDFEVKAIQQGIGRLGQNNNHNDQDLEEEDEDLVDDDEDLEDDDEDYEYE